MMSVYPSGLAHTNLTRNGENHRNAVPCNSTVLTGSYGAHDVDIRPQARSMSHHFSKEAQDFSGSAMKKTANELTKKPVIPLGTGRPIDELYPWKGDDFGMKGNGDYGLSESLNYCHAAGSPALVHYFTEHIKIVHDPPYTDWAVSLTCGSTAALETALRIFSTRGDSVLTEAFTYPGMIAIAQLLGVNLVGIDMDAQGLSAGHLEQTLQCWNSDRGRRPKVLYTIPCGQNPSGATQSVARKRAIYKVTEKYDLVLVEDDPYYFLQLAREVNSALDTDDQHEDDPTATAKSYLASLTPSYLSLDRSGRVIRLDSASKILAPGLRVGWVAASEAIIDKFVAYHEVSTVAVSGPTQLMLWNLLVNDWGHVGFLTWLDSLSRRYRARLGILHNACERHLPQNICKWSRPQHGIFLWISLDVRQHPDLRSTVDGRTQPPLQNAYAHIRGIEDRIYSKAFDAGVQITKGSLFEAGQSHSPSKTAVPPPGLHLRLTYAAAKESDLSEGARLLGQVLREEFGIVRNH